MNQLLLRAVLLTILTTCVAAAAASAEAAGYRGLSEWMQSHIDARRLVGCSAQVTRDGETVFLEAFGKRSPAAAETLGVDQVVRIYSMSKPITSAAVMQLVEQGALDLDDPVSMYIPEFAAMTVGVGEDAYPARRPITIRDLLTHTSGLTYGFSAPEHLKAAYQAVFKPGTTLAEAAAGMGSLPLLQDVGTGFVYGVNTEVLGR
ncbi:MAG: serine hydrolase domain-containing protein, partial [Phycisphaerales bacterium]|nr:serine hydrolase domain-containing protein [Phycisphaerales bacterium]